MRSIDYAKRAEEVRTIADWIEPSRYLEKNTHAASTEAKAQLLRVAAVYENLADTMRRIEHVLIRTGDRQASAASSALLDTFGELDEDEETLEIEDPPEPIEFQEDAGCGEKTNPAERPSPPGR
jgi:hypothetical protein